MSNIALITQNTDMANAVERTKLALTMPHSRVLRLMRIKGPGEGSGSCAQLRVVSDADDASAKSTVTAEATSVTKVSDLPHQVTYPNQQVRAIRSEDLPAASPSVTKVKSPKSRNHHHARGAEVASTQAPNGKLSHEQLVQVVREDLAYGRASSSYDLARRTGWSQSAVNRLQRKLRDQCEPQS